MSHSFATRTLEARAPEGPAWRPPYRRSLLLSLAGASLAGVNMILLHSAWALGSGAQAWESHVQRLQSPAIWTLHALLFAIACYFAWGFARSLARFAGQARARLVLTGCGLALGATAALTWVLCAGGLP